jgi:hypothetical protein
MVFHFKAPPPSSYSGLTAVYNTSHRERDDNYRNVILHTLPRWRIILCRNANQWIIQNRSAEPLNRGKWTGVSYVVSRDKLIELSTTLGLLSDAAARAVLDGLPENIQPPRPKLGQHKAGDE